VFKAWDRQGGVSHLTYYGIVVIDDPFGGNIQHCEILPHCIYNFFQKNGKHGWQMLGGIVLCITGIFN
jgi:hypothetical protein